MATTILSSPSHKRFLDLGAKTTRTEHGRIHFGSIKEIHYYGPCASCGTEMRDVDEQGFEDVSHQPDHGLFGGEPDVTICTSCSHQRHMDSHPLDGRQAKCHCGKTVPSSWSLPFFRFKGEGSEDATESCKICNYNLVAHLLKDHMAKIDPNGKTRLENFMAEVGRHEFEPHGVFEFDSFYCGCNGWD